MPGLVTRRIRTRTSSASWRAANHHRSVRLLFASRYIQNDELAHSLTQNPPTNSLAWVLRLALPRDDDLGSAAGRRLRAPQHREHHLTDRHQHLRGDRVRRGSPQGEACDAMRAHRMRRRGGGAGRLTNRGGTRYLDHAAQGHPVEARRRPGEDPR